jgi:alkanesulfonate monooxygenase SsuD/methylene tetrahydromethanopterin reductase-like flavin-dependent oxidoreductase (luciferase family)
MLDCISGGRLVAGMPLGTPMDANLCYGITPMEHRERYYEAHDLIMKAWQSKEIFAWNGKYFKLPMVNLWPRPLQKPHPPVWIPGSGSLSTWDFTAKHNHCYCFLSYYRNNLGKRVMDGFWEFVARTNLDANPYRAGFLQLVVVAESDAKTEELYYPHIRFLRQTTCTSSGTTRPCPAQPGPSQPGQQCQESVSDAARPDGESASGVQGISSKTSLDRRQPSR